MYSPAASCGCQLHSVDEALEGLNVRELVQGFLEDQSPRSGASRI